jgi:hypothetical protein
LRIEDYRIKRQKISERFYRGNKIESPAQGSKNGEVIWGLYLGSIPHLKILNPIFSNKSLDFLSSLKVTFSQGGLVRFFLTGASAERNAFFRSRGPNPSPMTFGG